MAKIDTRPYEMALLRGVFHKEQARELARSVSPRLFGDENAKAMFTAFQRLHFSKTPVTRDSIILELAAIGDVDEQNIGVLVDEVSSLPEPVAITKLIEGLGTMRARVLMEELREYLETPEARRNGMIGAVSKINEFTASLHSVSAQKPETLMATMLRVMERTEPAKVWVPGLGRLDNWWKIRKGSYTVIGADSGSGKTALAVNIALNLVAQGATVGFISIEMTKDELAFRAGAIMAGVDSSRLEDNTITPAERQHVLHTIQSHPEIFNRIIIIDDATIAVENLHAKYNELITVYGCEIIMIDYIQRIGMMGKNNGKTDITTAASETITAITKSTGVATIALSVLNEEASAFGSNNSSGGKRRKGLSNLKNARQIGHDASMVVILTMMEGSQPDDVQKYIVVESVKSRKGQWFCKPLLFDGPTQRFSDDGKNVELTN